MKLSFLHTHETCENFSHFVPSIFQLCFPWHVAWLPVHTTSFVSLHHCLAIYTATPSSDHAPSHDLQSQVSKRLSRRDAGGRQRKHRLFLDSSVKWNSSSWQPNPKAGHCAVHKSGQNTPLENWSLSKGGNCYTKINFVPQNSQPTVPPGSRLRVRTRLPSWATRSLLIWKKTQVCSLLPALGGKL